MSNNQKGGMNEIVDAAIQIDYVISVKILATDKNFMAVYFNQITIETQMQNMVGTTCYVAPNTYESSAHHN